MVPPDKENVCFVLTSSAPAGTEIRQHTDGLLDFVVVPGAEAAGYRVVRMDAIAEPYQVSDAVIAQLRDARVVVADLSFSDANVMYALGVRHSYGKPAIHIHTPQSHFPFDLAGLSAVVIDLGDIASVRRAQKEFARKLDEAADATQEVSPVMATMQLDVLRSAELDDERTSALVNGLKAIEQRLVVIERSAHAPEPAGDGVVQSRKVFIVHGHDGELKHQLARTLTSLEFDVVILQELADSGRTIFDKLQTEVDEIGFVFVLLTPDDFGAAESGQAAPRARQNVIFEHGLFNGLVGPHRVCAIQRGEIELPSDLYGLVVKHIPEGAGIDAIQFDLVQELKRAGYVVDANLLTGS